MLPKPYYNKGPIRIYKGDCRLIMDDIPRKHVDLLLTDPPYGIDQDPQKFSGADFVKVKDDDKPFDPSQLLSFNRVVIWGANNFCHLISPSLHVPTEYQPFGGWLAWDKTLDNNVEVKISHGELAWCNTFRGIRFFRHLWSGAYRASESAVHVHPTQKPVVLMKWVIEMFTKPGDLVFDPYMGSGPVAQACYELDRKYVGIEWEETYIKIAIKRLSVNRLFAQ